MKKVVLAINHREGEEYIIENASRYDAVVVGMPLNNRDGILPQLQALQPDVVIIREKNLPGKIEFEELIYEIRKTFPNLSIIFMANKRVPGDKLLSVLVSYGVYNLIYGENSTHLDEILDLIVNPKNYQQVSHLQIRTDHVGTFEITPQQQPDETLELILTENNENEKKPMGLLGLTRRFLKEKIIFNKEHDRFDEEQKKKETENPKDRLWPFLKQQKVVKTVVPAIIAVTGIKEGLGVSTLAYNLATVLAEEHSTSLVELDIRLPYLSYLLGFEMQRSLPDILNQYALGQKEFNTLSKTDLININENLKSIYQKLPQKLNFILAGSDLYYQPKEINYREGVITDILQKLLFQKRNTFVVVDCEPNNLYSKEALETASVIVFVINQDASTIGYSNYLIKELSTRKKVVVVLNQESNLAWSNKEVLQKYLDVKVDMVLPYDEGCIKSSYDGIPAYMLPETSEPWKNQIIKLSKIVKEEN